MTTPELDLSNLSDEERIALEGEDPGSLADAEVQAKAAEAIKDDPEPEPTPEPEPEPEPAAAGTDDGPLAPRLAMPSLEGADEQLNALLDQRKTIREQYRNGDLSAEDKDRAEDELNEKISDLRAEQKQARFVENFNQQMAEQEYLRTIERVKADVLARDGIDYDKNPMLLQTWDFKVRALASDPANADKPGDWYLREAHKQVMAEAEAAAAALGFQRGPRGRPSTAQEVVNDAIRNRRPPETRAKSLAALPAAAQDTGHDAAEFSQLDRLSGDDLEAAVARMTPEQQERWARL